MRKKENWMDLDQDEIDLLDNESWLHYKDGGCLCWAKCKSECVCGAWREE